MTARRLLLPPALIPALLEGRMSEVWLPFKLPNEYCAYEVIEHMYENCWSFRNKDTGMPFLMFSPYAIGDELWLAETWRVGAWRDDGRMAFDYKASPELTKTPWVYPPHDKFSDLNLESFKECELANLKGLCGAEYNRYGVYKYTWEAGKSPCHWRPSTQMPQWASRWKGTVTGIEPRMVKGITDDEAKACGVVDKYISINGTLSKVSQVMINHGEMGSLINGFHHFWQSAYPRYPFDTSWAWRYQIKEVKA